MLLFRSSRNFPSTVNTGGNNAATFTSPATGTGCDSTTTLNLTVNPVLTANENITICSSQLPYTWNGITVNTGGNSVATFTTPAAGTGCDSTTTLNLTVNPLLTATENITICSSQLPFMWNGITVNTGGNNAATFTSPATVTGCDSTTTLNLTVNPLPTATENVTICSNQLPYTWNGITVNTGGNNAATFTSPAAGTGCDSTTTLNLTVNPLLTATENITICSNQLPYTWNGITVNAGGNSVATFTSPATATGCDSVTTLNLTVNPVFAVSVDTIICNSQIPYVFGPQLLNQSGNYTQAFTTFKGCDSIINLHLIVSPPPFTAPPLTVTGCDVVIFEGANYTTSQVLKDTFYNVRNCDSLYRTVNIVVMSAARTEIEASICAGGAYNFDGDNYSSAGTYTKTYIGTGGCDSVRELTLTVHPLPVLDISVGEDPLICVGDTLQLSGSGAAYYSWSVNNHIASTSNPAAIPLPLRENIVMLNGESTFQCQDSISISIAAEDCCGISVPNAFSPNNDGLNDGFGVITAGHPKSYKLQVFDRWGKKVFVSYSIYNQWNGTFNNIMSDAGTYFYTIQSECSDGSLFYKKGTIVLIR